MIKYICDFCDEESNEYTGADMYNLTLVNESVYADTYEGMIICEKCLRKMRDKRLKILAERKARVDNGI